MNKDQLKEYMPIPYFLHKIQRSRLKNKDITILCNNCLGGVIYHCLGLQFLSPTVNLMVNSTADFIKFCKNIDYYLQLTITEIQDETVPYPVGMCGDIKLHFNHYRTFSEAVSKWEIRKKRINWDNLYIISNDYISDTVFLSREEILEFGELKCKNLIMFTSVKYPDIPYTYYLGLKKLKRFMFTHRLTGLREFEKYWDYVSFLNAEKDNKR